MLLARSSGASASSRCNSCVQHNGNKREKRGFDATKRKVRVSRALSREGMRGALVVQAASERDASKGDAFNGAFDREDTTKKYSFSQKFSVMKGMSTEKPLKINQDILLYKLRQKRQKARRVNNPKLRSKLLEEVEEGLLKCLSRDPTDGRPYVSLGKHYASLGRLEEAAKVYEEGTKATKGENAYIWQAWATLECRRNDVSRARKLFDAATVADNQHAAAWHGWGMMEKRQGNYKRARDLFVKGIRYQPAQNPNAFLYHSVGVLAAEQGRPDEARQWYMEACNVGLGKTSPALWQSWGLLEYSQGNLMDARQILKSGLDKHPKNRFLWLAWADLEAKEGNGERARRLFKNGHSLNPKDPAILQAWARLEASLGDIDRARALFKRGTKVDPDHQPLWQAWAIMEWKLNELDKARELFQRGVWVSPESPDACKLFQAWGLLEGQEGNVELARSLFKCAVKVDPNSLPAWQAWAQLEEGIGNLLRANELKSYSLQTRIEEAGNLDLSPTAAASDSFFVPILKKLSDWVSSPVEYGTRRAPPRKIDSSTIGSPNIRNN